MRKLIGALLAMTALMPATANAQDGRRGPRAERRADGGVRAGARADAQVGGAAFRADRRDDRADFVRERRDDVRAFRADRRDDRQDFARERRDDRQALRDGAVTRPEFRADRRDDRADFRNERRDDVRDFRNDRRDDRRDFARERRDDRRGVVGAPGRPGFGLGGGAGVVRDRSDWSGNDWNRSAFNRGDRGGWNRGWRQDARYDWNRYRGVNRAAYRLPRYYAPYGAGFGYRRFSIGVGLQAGLWSRNYWIADPYAYRLPPVDGPYRWVRYYDDALLVDLETGVVVDAVYGIFW